MSKRTAGASGLSRMLMSLCHGGQRKSLDLNLSGRALLRTFVWSWLSLSLLLIVLTPVFMTLALIPPLTYICGNIAAALPALGMVGLVAAAPLAVLSVFFWARDTTPSPSLLSDVTT